MREVTARFLKDIEDVFRDCGLSRQERSRLSGEAIDHLHSTRQVTFKELQSLKRKLKRR